MRTVHLSSHNPQFAAFRHCERYDTLDANNTAFVVFNDRASRLITVFGRSANTQIARNECKRKWNRYEQDSSFDKIMLEIEYEKIWLGIAPNHTDANCVLLQIQPLVYLFIGIDIFEFSTKEHIDILKAPIVKGTPFVTCETSNFVYNMISKTMRQKGSSRSRHFGIVEIAQRGMLRFRCEEHGGWEILRAVGDLVMLGALIVGSGFR